MKFLILSLIVLPTLSFSSDKNYSQEDFIKKVNEEVKKQVDVIKAKSVAELTKELLDKEEKLKLRELELQKKEDALKASDADVAKKYTELANQQKEILGCMKKNDEDAKARVAQLVEMISNMKPEKAASVLSVQDTDIAVSILQTIEPKKASKIFNFMDKDISAKLQKQYLQMKK